MKRSIFSLAKRCILIVFVVLALPAHANDHGGAGAPAGEALQFIVNLGSESAEGKYLQLSIVFGFAKPEIAQRLASMKPKIQHRMILLLSSQDAASLLTIKGKLKLQEQIVEEVNGLLDETTKTGVKEVLFTNFIIQ